MAEVPTKFDTVRLVTSSKDPDGSAEPVHTAVATSS